MNYGYFLSEGFINFFFFPAMTHPCAPPEAKWFESTTSVSKVFLYLVGAVKGLSERLYQREDSNTNNLLSKLLFSNCL